VVGWFVINLHVVFAITIVISASYIQAQHCASMFATVVCVCVYVLCYVMCVCMCMCLLFRFYVMLNEKNEVIYVQGIVLRNL
jgi:hypothetical protein